MSQFCQIEYVSSDSDVGMPYGKTAVVKCSDCGSAICSDCQTECCGSSFCVLCYDYHVTHSCVRKPVQNERSPYSVFDSPEKAVRPSLLLARPARSRTVTAD